MTKNIVRLISASGSEIKKMSGRDLKLAVQKSEGRVILAQHLLFAGEGLVRGVTNSELNKAGSTLSGIGE